MIPGPATVLCVGDRLILLKDGARIDLTEREAEETLRELAEKLKAFKAAKPR